jgi:hypothetical protein
VNNFSNNTSDHFPVYAFYDWKKLTTRIIPANIAEEHAFIAWCVSLGEQKYMSRLGDIHAEIRVLV